MYGWERCEAPGCASSTATSCGCVIWREGAGIPCASYSLQRLLRLWPTPRCPARSPACVACGSAPAITAASLPQYDYTAFTGQAAANDAAPLPLQLIPWEERITPAELQQRCAACMRGGWGWVGWGGGGPQTGGTRAAGGSWVGCGARTPARTVTALLSWGVACDRNLLDWAVPTPPAGWHLSRELCWWTCGQRSSTTSATCRVRLGGGGDAVSALRAPSVAGLRVAKRKCGTGRCNGLQCKALHTRAGPPSFPGCSTWLCLSEAGLFTWSPCAGAVHAPYKHFSRHLDAIQERLAAAAGVSLPPPAAAAGQQGQQDGGGTEQQDGTAPPPPPLYVVCRRGNDSQRAVAALRAAGISHGVDVMGGMEGWAREVDQGFPTY